MKFHNVVKRKLRGKSPLILTVVAGIGTATTAYFAARGAYKSANVIRDDRNFNGIIEDKKDRLKHDVKLTWKNYIPATVSGATTIACVVGANRLEVKKTIAAQTALAISQKAYSEYKEQVVKELGPKKASAIKEKIVEEKVKNNPPPTNMLAVGAGNIICCELYTGRYFSADIEELRKAVNELNAQLLKQDYATMNDFYYLINLKQTTKSGSLGWKTPRLMDLDFTTALTDDGRPCLAFDYNYVDPV